MVLLTLLKGKTSQYSCFKIIRKKQAQRRAFRPHDISEKLNQLHPSIFK